MMLNILLLIVYILANILVVWRGITWLNKTFKFKNSKVINIVIAVIYAIAASTLIIWIFIPNGDFRVLVQKTGNFWYGLFSVLVTLVILAELFLLIVRLIGKKTNKNIAENRGVYAFTGIAVIGITVILIIYGSINAQKIYVNTYETTVNKSAGNIKNLEIALVADLHIGLDAGTAQITDMVDKINQLNPDIVVMAGDLFDNDYDAIDDPQEIMNQLRRINSTYGVYAVYGNHDVKNTLVGGFTISNDSMRDERMEKLLTDSNITVMKDDTVLIGNSIYLIGRIDGEEPGEIITRKTINELTDNIDKSKPVIMINHEPDDLGDYEKCGVDIFLGGHTHNGQLFPLTLARHFKWENPAGYLRKGNMDSYVTQGVGVYGPYMRTFSHAEVMGINVSFN